MTMVRRSWLAYLLPVGLLLLFALLLNSGGVLKRPLGRQDDVQGEIRQMQLAIERDAWQEALSAHERVGLACSAANGF